MSTCTIHFKEADADKIQRLLDFVRSLDFVQSIEGESPAPDAATPAASASDKFQSVAELRVLYPGEWVLLANPIRNGAALLGGEVLCHDRDKRQFALKARDFIQSHPGATHFFTSEPPRRAHVGLARKTAA